MVCGREEGRSFNCGYVFTLYSLIIEIFENKNTYVYILMRGTPLSRCSCALVWWGLAVKRMLLLKE